MKFHLDIRETLVTGREVEANTIEEAKEQIKQMYENGEIVLTSEDFSGDVDVRVLDTDYNVLEEWDENYVK